MFRWVINWFAFLVQLPSQKPGTILVVKSDCGAGKNVIVDFIGKRVLGLGFFFETSDVDKVLGKFNGLIEGTRLISFSEAALTKDNYHTSHAKLKSLITDDTVTIEEKNINPRVVDNFTAFMIATNAENPIKVEKSDRRTMCLEISDQRIGDTEYFDKLHDLTRQNPDTPAAFMAYLMGVEVDATLAHKPLDTEMRRALRFEHLPATARFLAEYLDENDPDTNGSLAVEAERFYNRFTDWCQRCGENPKAACAFGRTLTHYGCEKQRRRQANERIYFYELRGAKVERDPAANRP